MTQWTKSGGQTVDSPKGLEQCGELTSPHSLPLQLATQSYLLIPLNFRPQLRKSHTHVIVWPKLDRVNHTWQYEGGKASPVVPCTLSERLLGNGRRKSQYRETLLGYEGNHHKYCQHRAIPKGSLHLDCDITGELRNCATRQVASGICKPTSLKIKLQLCTLWVIHSVFF